MPRTCVGYSHSATHMHRVIKTWSSTFCLATFCKKIALHENFDHAAAASRLSPEDGWSIGQKLYSAIDKEGISPCLQVSKQENLLGSCSAPPSAAMHDSLQWRPKASPATQNALRKSSEDKHNEVMGTTFSLCLCLKCSKTHLQASLIPKFSRR